MYHSFFGHPFANWIAGMKRVRLDESKLLVPRF
jgi:hypothetical protein